jgi:hypothetical protein
MQDLTELRKTVYVYIREENNPTDGRTVSSTGRWWIKELRHSHYLVKPMLQRPSNSPHWSKGAQFKELNSDLPVFNRAYMHASRILVSVPSLDDFLCTC